MTTVAHAPDAEAAAAPSACCGSGSPNADATAAALSELGAPAESLDVRAGDAAAGWDEVRISIEPGAVN